MNVRPAAAAVSGHVHVGRSDAPLIELPADKLSYRVKEVTHATGLSKPKIYGLIAAGRLQVVRVDNCILIPRASLEKLLNAEK